MSAAAKDPQKGQMVLVGNVAGDRAAIVSHVYDGGSINCATFTREGLVVPRAGIVPERARTTPDQECWKPLQVSDAE